MKLKNTGVWPDNLISDVVTYSALVGRSLKFKEKPKDFNGSLHYVLTTFLTTRELAIIFMRYDAHMTLDDIAGEHGITRERVRQIINKAVRKLSRASTFEFLSLGVQGVITKRADQNLEITRNKTLPTTPIEELDLSCRAYNCLTIFGAKTLGDIMTLDLDAFAKRRNVGAKTLDEIVCIRVNADEAWTKTDKRADEADGQVEA